MGLVVSDTSTLIHLAAIGRLDLLYDRALDAVGEGGDDG
jgi:predicted nucleic acid-binding protein